MSQYPPGIYEQLVTDAVEEALAEIGTRWIIKRDALRPEEAPDRIALHLGMLIKGVVARLEGSTRVPTAIALARTIVDQLATDGDERDGKQRPHVQASVLRALLGRLPNGDAENLVEPATPLLDTTLLTNAPGEPHIGFQLKTEIPSADRIDVLMAFVRTSGIKPLEENLRRHCERGRTLRLITTTYTGSTELQALKRLRDLGANIRVSYDQSNTRLHAKAWLFHRETGFSTAFIGSSNLTHSAQITGMEWNLRVSGARNPDVIDKFSAVFESYWNDADFLPFDEAQFRMLTQRESDQSPGFMVPPTEIRLEPFQARLLELIALSREAGHQRNLLVAATGTGKTVMAAMDYVRLRSKMKRARLLFVAHREEILKQSIATFRHALREPAFGELWVGGKSPQVFEHVFASIMSISVAGLEHLAPDHFDVVIVDEFHHAAASTYDALLNHLKPLQLLGLTATPERGDGRPILQWFDGRIAAELRLWDAIDQQRLVPFSYFGVADGTDLTEVPWYRGRGYDPKVLERVVTADDVLARRVMARVAEYVPNPDSMRAIGFCVSVGHAHFMARNFSAAGIPSAAVTANSENDVRKDSLKELSEGNIRVLFAVDLFNEGVDIPPVDTLLLLRPTDSATIFLQQLGRGLRLHPGKTVCTVLDFVANHRKEFRFQNRLGSLLRGGRKSLIEQVEAGFPFLPAGCHMQLDRIASEIVLRNLKEAVPSQWASKVVELRRVAALRGPRIRLAEFLEESGLDLPDVYTGNKCWSSLRESAGLSTLASGPNEHVLRRGLGRLLHVDSKDRIDAMARWARNPQAIQSLADWSLSERRLLHMMLAVVVWRVVPKGASLQEMAQELARHPQVLAEVGELAAVLDRNRTHLHEPWLSRPAIPLRIHARYSRSEVMAAMGQASTAGVGLSQSGVEWFQQEQTDVFFVTLDKSGSRFSPTTRYRDYAISRTLFHWESQAKTREDSPTGLRYRKHKEQGSHVLLFIRQSPDDRAFWFVGPANYVSHKGERPMAIEWRLEHELPGDLYVEFAAAVA